MLYIGIDAKPFWKTIQSKFSSTIAVAVVTSDYETLKQNYIHDFKSVLNKYNYSSERVIGKGYELARQGINSDIIKEILQAASKYIKKLFVYYAVFSLQDKQNQVSVPQLDGTINQISIQDFLRHYLDNYFPLVCYWALQKNKAQLGDECQFYLDSFQGRSSKAWESVKHNSDFFVYPMGDKVNALISLSDLFNHYLTNELLHSDKHMKADFIRDIFKTDFPTLEIMPVPISNWALYNIVPDGRQLDCRKKWKKPVICLIIEKDSQIPRKIIEASPHVNHTYNFAFSKNGCLKFFDINQDIPFLDKDDYLIYYGVEGENIAKQLSSLGYKFRISHLKDISEGSIESKMERKVI